MLLLRVMHNTCAQACPPCLWSSSQTFNPLSFLNHLAQQSQKATQHPVRLPHSPSVSSATHFIFPGDLVGLKHCSTFPLFCNAEWIFQRSSQKSHGGGRGFCGFCNRWAIIRQIMVFLDGKPPLLSVGFINSLSRALEWDDIIFQYPH